MKEKNIYKFIDIDFILKNEEIHLPQAYKEAMKKNWDRQMARGKKYKNGILYTITDYKFDEGKREIYIQQTSYSHYLYSREGQFNIHSCRSVASNALFLTSDNYFVLGKMQKTTSLPEKIKFIGGAVDKEDIGDFNRVDFKKCIKRECNEEIGIELTDERYVKKIEPLTYITRPYLTFVNVLFDVHVLMNKNEMEKNFKEFQMKLAACGNKEIELQEIIFVHKDKDSVMKFLENSKNNLIDYMKDFFEAYFGICEYGDFEDYVKQILRK